MAGNKVNKAKGKYDKSKGTSIVPANEETENYDFSLLRKPIQTSITGLGQAIKIFDLATEEVSTYLASMYMLPTFIMCSVTPCTYCHIILCFSSKNYYLMNVMCFMNAKCAEIYLGVWLISFLIKGYIVRTHSIQTNMDILFSQHLL